MKTLSICLAIAIAPLAASFSFAADVPPLFDGKSLAQFENGNGGDAAEGWQVKDGVIHLQKGEGAPKGGNLYSRLEYANYRLSFDWKISKGGNNGIKYRVHKYGGSWLGCEYQLYDDVGKKISPTSRTSTASIYALYPPDGAKKLKTAGEEFNTSTIIVEGDRVEHWLNGDKVVEALTGSDEWRKRVAGSKFKSKMNFGEQEFGRIMITDHNDEVWIRNLKIEPIGDLPFAREPQPSNLPNEEPPRP